MSTQEVPLTYEGVMGMIRESARNFDRMMQESNEKFDRIMQETNRKISDLGSRVGEIVENMVAGNIVAKFQAKGYGVTDCKKNWPFKNKKLGIRGEVDLFLDDDPDDGEVAEIAILIEVKTALETYDVRKHIERLEKFRRCLDARGNTAKMRVIGAVAGGVIKGDADEVAQENGLYVIVQSGDAVEIVVPPEGFVAKEW